MSTWTPICHTNSLSTERGAAALVANDNGHHQVALFKLACGELYAVGHRDPFSGANVMARGIVGNRGDVPTITSPVYKQVFDLRTGEALDHPGVKLESWDSRDVDGVIHVRAIGA